MKTYGRRIIPLPLMLLSFLLFNSSLAQGPPPAKVRVAPAVEEEVAKTQEVIGVLYYDRVSNLSSEVAGLVEEVKVRQGDTVTKGTPLVTLNTDILNKEIALQNSRIERAKLRIADASKNYTRLEKLFDKAGVSEKERDDALYNFQDAQLEKQEAEDSLQKLQLEMEKSIINAPFDGIVLSKDVDTGSWVQQGRQLFSFGSTADIFIRAPIAETNLQFIEEGMKVPVTINAFDRQVEGTVVDIDPVADMKTKNIFLKISIPPQPLVAQNMSAKVTVPASAKQLLRVIDRASVIKFQGKDFVYTVKDGNAAILPVNIVAFLDERVGVDSPHIVAGMPLVVEGNERLRPDQPVTVAGE